jgi:hypothetical protein
MFLLTLLSLGCVVPLLPPTATDHPASAEAPRASAEPASSVLEPDAQDSPNSAAAIVLPPDETHGETTTAGAEDATATSSPQMAVYTCPMHPDVIRAEAGTCPKCGMQLVMKKQP